MALSSEWAKATVELLGETEGGTEKETERGREGGRWRMSSRQKQTEGDDNEKLKAVKEMRCRFELQSRAVDLRLPRRRRVFLHL